MAHRVLAKKWPGSESGYIFLWSGSASKWNISPAMVSESLKLKDEW